MPQDDRLMRALHAIAVAIQMDLIDKHPAGTGGNDFDSADI